MSRTRVELLGEEVRACERCALHQEPGRCISRGSPRAELMFVGEAPGADDAARGLSFVGTAGQLLDRMIGEMGYGPSDVYITQAVKCRPPGNRKPDPTETAACGSFLAREIALVSPRAIVALGATAAQVLLGTTMGITQLHGKWHLYRGLTPVMPTFHPAYVLKDPSVRSVVRSELQEVQDYLASERARRLRLRLPNAQAKEAPPESVFVEIPKLVGRNAAIEGIVHLRATLAAFAEEAAKPGAKPLPIAEALHQETARIIAATTPLSVVVSSAGEPFE